VVSTERVLRLQNAWQVDSADTRVKILLAGRLTRWKGQLVLIDAAARLKARGNKDFLIVLAGDAQGRDSYVAEIEAAIARNSLQKNVRIVGHCDDMPAAYLACDLAAAPSQDPEAFGRTAVEPQIMGRPVLASNHGGATETVVDGQTGWLVKPDDAKAWADALTEAVTATRGRREGMGRVGQERARRLYSVEAMCTATLAVYEQVLARRAAGQNRR
jgi:glycosyltransferase involved in cell wall biosynthesis